MTKYELLLAVDLPPMLVGRPAGSDPAQHITHETYDVGSASNGEGVPWTIHEEMQFASIAMQ